MEGWLGVENMYDVDPRLARHSEQALRAHAVKRDRDYIVKDGEIIVDEFRAADAGPPPGEGSTRRSKPKGCVSARASPGNDTSRTTSG